MKKAVSIVMALVMCAGMATVALGDNYHQDGDASTLISFEWKNDPTYSMTIPESVVMTNEGVDVDFTASDVEYMEGKELVVPYLHGQIPRPDAPKLHGQQPFRALPACNAGRQDS